jgi:Putative sensor
MNSIALENPTPRRMRLLPPPRTMALDAVHLVLGLPAGIAIFTIMVTGLSVGAGLAITLVGIPILLSTLLLARGLAEVERRRAGLALDERIRGRERRLEGAAMDRARILATDPASWRDVLWGLLVLPVGTAGFTVAVALWSTALGLVASPVYWWALGDEPGEPALFDDPGAGYSVLRVLIGLALIPVAAWLSRATAAGSARLARALLG